jgi:hypothetical protein
MLIAYVILNSCSIFLLACGLNCPLQSPLIGRGSLQALPCCQRVFFNERCRPILWPCRKVLLANTWSSARSSVKKYFPEEAWMVQHSPNDTLSTCDTCAKQANKLLKFTGSSCHIQLLLGFCSSATPELRVRRGEFQKEQIFSSLSF